MPSHWQVAPRRQPSTPSAFRQRALAAFLPACPFPAAAGAGLVASRACNTALVLDGAILEFARQRKAGLGPQRLAPGASGCFVPLATSPCGGGQRSWPWRRASPQRPPCRVVECRSRLCATPSLPRLHQRRLPGGCGQSEANARKGACGNQQPVVWEAARCCCQVPAHYCNFALQPFAFGARQKATSRKLPRKPAVEGVIHSFLLMRKPSNTRVSSNQTYYPYKFGPMAMKSCSSKSLAYCRQCCPPASGGRGLLHGGVRAM